MGCNGFLPWSDRSCLIWELWGTLGGAEYLAGAAMAGGVSVLLREHPTHLHAHTHIDPHHQHQHEEVVVGSHANWHRHLPLQHDHGYVPDVQHRHEH